MALKSVYKKAGDAKIDMVLNGHSIHSLKELREYFNMEELMKYHVEGNLLKWLEQHYYEKEAEQIEEIDFNQAGCAKKICAILGIDYVESKNMSEEEKARWEEKRRIVSQYTTDPKILSELWLVAMNQEELAELLNNHEEKIYLCQDSFSIPIRVAGVEYIGLGNAVIENPYTQAQYEKAGIKVSGFSLPEVEDPATAEIAKSAAASNGYDDFHESHTPLATAFHKKLKSIRLMTPHHISYNSAIECNFFTSKYECEEAKKSCVRKAYNEAEKYITSGNSKSLSREAAEFYSEQIRSAFEGVRKKLENLSALTGTEEQYQLIIEKVDKSYKSLLAEFDSELDDNRSYYGMYNFDYFIDQVDIEEHDFRISEDFFGRAFETLFTDNVQYTITGLFSAISEIESDLETRANTFYGSAISSYRAYVSEIEKLLDKIGKGLPEMAENEDIDDYITRCCIKKAV